MQHREFAPPEELQDVIKCFWYNSRDFRETEPDFEVMPDGNAEIIFMFKSGCSILRNGQQEPLPSPFIMGLLGQPVQLHTEGDLEILGIRCFPWTVFDLLGLTAGKEEVHIFKHPIADLQPTLSKYLEAGDIGAAIAELTRYFLHVRAQVTSESMLFKAGTAMSKAKGSIAVSAVATAAHATVRTLERKFKQSSGYTVKDVSGLIRFEQVRNRLWWYPDTNLAGLAHEFGYADQAHLSREFKRYSGSTPAAFAKKQKMVFSDFVVFIQS